MLLTVILLSLAFAAAAARNPFTVLETRGDFELVRIDNVDPLRVASGPTRCFLRSKAAGQRPALFLYPKKNDWAVAMPMDVLNAAYWEQRHVNRAVIPALPVTFALRIDGGPEIRHNEQVRVVDPHKRRNIYFPLGQRPRLYEQLLLGREATLSWRAQGIGADVEGLIRFGLGKEQPPVAVRYDLEGLDDFVEHAKAACK